MNELDKALHKIKVQRFWLLVWYISLTIAVGFVFKDFGFEFYHGCIAYFIFRQSILASS